MTRFQNFQVNAESKRKQDEENVNAMRDKKKADREAEFEKNQIQKKFKKMTNIARKTILEHDCGSFVFLKLFFVNSLQGWRILRILFRLYGLVSVTVKSCRKK